MFHGPISKYCAAINKPAGDRPEHTGIVRTDAVIAHYKIFLAWHLHRSPNSLPIPGTTSISHAEANIAAWRLSLSSDEIGQLTDLTPEG